MTEGFLERKQRCRISRRQVAVDLRPGLRVRHVYDAIHVQPIGADKERRVRRVEV